MSVQKFFTLIQYNFPPFGISISEEEQESGEDESEEDSENESESSGPEGTPGNSEDRPSFVNRMLSGLFG
ncbi:hypothetical protein HRED_09707 [Candidatus Haloredivivus sp. G17]|nr:hypothetical protein HRED_09707 [Candidatus Haloredivivus sp. G17]